MLNEIELYNRELFLSRCKNEIIKNCAVGKKNNKISYLAIKNLFTAEPVARRKFLKR